MARAASHSWRTSPGSRWARSSSFSSAGGSSPWSGCEPRSRLEDTGGTIQWNVDRYQGRGWQRYHGRRELTVLRLNRTKRTGQNQPHPRTLMASRFLVVLAFALACVGGLSAYADAQSATGTISGIVVDETAAVVPGATMSLVNLATGLQRTVATDSGGRFVVALLPPGTYQVTGRHDGFNPAEINQLTLNVGDAVEVKLLLKVARLDQSVTVSAEPARVSTSPAVGTVVDRQFVANLQLHGSSLQSLITMTPGVVLTPASSTSPGQFSVNGQRSDANYFMVDGVSANVGVQT